MTKHPTVHRRNPPKKYVRIQMPADLDAQTEATARKAGLSQPAFLGLCVRHGWRAARAAALGIPQMEDAA